MPRRPRVSVEGGIYQVYNRFARGVELFSGPDEAIELIRILRKAGNRDGLRPEVVTRWAARGAGLRQADSEFREAYEELNRAIAVRVRGRQQWR